MKTRIQLKAMIPEARGWLLQQVMANYDCGDPLFFIFGSGYGRAEASLVSRGRRVRASESRR